MSLQQPDFPELRTEHFSRARIYANRYDLVRNLGIPRHSVIAEVGVAHGDFSQFLLDELKPLEFFAIDLFEMEKYPLHWGIRQEILLEGKSHFDFYRERFAHHGSRMNLVRGLSSETLPRMQDKLADMIYIDAGHDYENVSHDAKISARKIKDGGLIIFNDYTLFDPFLKAEYGVVQAVNELIDGGNWEVAGFALQKHMFCDIAIRQSAC